ncbi:polyprenyl synthase [Scardovia inopinata]|uniref:Polyprenyl synthetase n=1 Tax=Scardovia inopinata F0304 TaxID=641146 RepID=W5IK23_SCAIO|nr:polyprenyl synthetase family protein [Scardovia inopinata]EFG27217.1 hypothetical protein HMPREF9020_00856 [Scardovia inopinata F0304]BAR06828.1 isoprenyl diphosphate synthase [Scardovia inopinata JCM 12537]SUV50889.1 polyprenyl synthase [Scardovia inopinata]
MNSLSFSKEDIDSRLLELVKESPAEGLPISQADADTRPSLPPYVDAVREQAVRSCQGGKRLRAQLLGAVAQACGLSADLMPSALDLACALEIFQTAALVHDDIIDDSDTRRGAPSAHRALANETGPEENLEKNSENNSEEKNHIGIGLGIMLGDILATLSVDVAHRSSRQFPQSYALLEAFLDMHRQVEKGQIMDLAMESLPLTDPDLIEDQAKQTYWWKTSSYTTIAPLRLALIACGYDPHTASSIAHQVGTPLGLAFQLNDDVIDIISLTSGKPLGGDIIEGKRTVLLADTLRSCSQEQKTLLLRIYSSGRPQPDAVQDVISLMQSCGAIDKSRHRIALLNHQAKSILIRQLEAAEEEGQRGREFHHGFSPDAEDMNHLLQIMDSFCSTV